MQPSSGDTPSISHIPQKPNKIATEIISLLSSERFGGRSIFMKTPQNAPIITLTIFIKTGEIIFFSSKLPPEPAPEARAIEIAML